MRRRKFLIATAATALGGWYCVRRAIYPSQWGALIPGLARTFPPRMDYLRELAAAVIEASRVRPGQSVGGSPPNSTGGTLIRPGGRDDYPACWLRDFAMSLDCGLIPAEEILHHLRLFARTQNGWMERRLLSLGVIPPFSIVDHVNFDGSAIFYPGSYDAYRQGGEPFGILPPVDDHYYFVHIAYCLYKLTKDPSFLAERIDYLTVMDRLLKAFDVPTSDESTGAVTTMPPRRAVGFGFCDAVFMTGAMLVPTLLRYQAARELAELCQAAGRPGAAPRFNQIAARILAHLPTVFSSADWPEGWLRAATGACHQPDVWGTLLALHMKVLPPGRAQRARASVAQAVRDGTIEYYGAVRHVPSDHDATPGTAWEIARAPLNCYQNGAYWHTATGWLVAALRDYDPPLAEKVFNRYADYLFDQDFRQGESYGAPWECIGRKHASRQNPVYMTSITVPLAVLANR